MEVIQIASLVNDALKQSIGESALLNEDLSNVVEVGTAVLNANAYESYSHALVNRIGRVIFVDRKYSGKFPSIMKTAWEFGSIAMKVSGGIPSVVENESWELTEGASYDPNIFYPDKSVKAKFYNGRITFEIDRSITDLQIKQSFTSREELNRFVSMLFTNIENALTIATENLARRLINSQMGDTIHSDYPSAQYSASSGVRAINVLKLYNDETGDGLSVADAMNDKDFLVYAARIIREYISKLSYASTLFNVGREVRWTSKDKLHVLIHSEFASRYATTAEASTFHRELVSLPYYEETGYWQGSGEDFRWSSTSKIDIKTGSGNDVSLANIICFMFDDNAIAIANYDKRVKTHYNEKSEFTNYFYKQDMEMLSDLNENSVVFFLA